MKLNVNDSTWLEISVSVFMYGSFLLSLKQDDNGVEINYTAAPDGYSGETQNEYMSDSRLSSILSEISKIDFDLDYDSDEDVYYTVEDSDDSSIWNVTFGNEETDICFMNGSTINSNVLKTILTVLKSFPLVENANEFIKQFE